MSKTDIDDLVGEFGNKWLEAFLEHDPDKAVEAAQTFQRAIFNRLAAEAVDVERWVGGNQSTGHAEAFKALPITKLKAIMEIKES